MFIDWLKNTISRPLHNPQNILESNVRVPETVYIVAGGPKGMAHYHRIPKDGYIIVANKSVLIPNMQPSMWILNSMNEGIRHWIGRAHKSFTGIRVFKESCQEKIPKNIRKTEYYIFSPNQDGNGEGNPRIPPGTLRAGGTVSGFSIQIAAHLGAREIILCGVDMSGQDYWDGRTGNNRNHGEVWSYTETINKTISALQREYNLKVCSLSPTKLNVPIC